MSEIPIWASGPFELIVHAEGHLRNGQDFDRRIALISFDNAIEVAITTYLTLKPIQRRGREYKKDKVDKWLNNYHTKIDFLEFEIKERKISWCVEKPNIIWIHDHRNEQYHSGSKGIPEMKVIEIARKASLWIFSLLFEVKDAEDELEKSLAQGEIEQGIRQYSGVSSVDSPASNTPLLWLVERVDESSVISPLENAVSEARSLQREGRFEEAIERWKSIANVAEGIDDDLAAHAWFSVGYLLEEGRHGESSGN